MKKSLVFMIAVLLVGALMISCNGDVSNNSDNLATVSIKAGTSKGLSTTPTSTVDDVENLYWYFTATKTDGSMFTTGATSEITPVVSAGTQGLVNKFIGGDGESRRYFSTGSWSFSFYGYKTSSTSENLIYKCENLAVTITGDTELTLTLETVSDSPAKLILGSSAPYWAYENATNESLTLKIYDGSTLLATSTATVSNNKATFTQLVVDNQNVSDVTLTAGIHSLDFEVWYGNEKVGSATLNLNAKANYSYPVTGDIANLNVTYSVKVKSTTTAVLETNSIDTNNKMSVSITPQAASTGTANTLTTSVDFSSANNVSNTDGSTYALEVDVLAGTGASVSAESENVNVANIDLTLTKTTTTGSGTTVENVTSFGSSGYVTVETYIGKDLSNVKVNGVAATTVNGVILDSVSENDTGFDTGISNVEYTQATGKLVFRTTHFSEFGVSSSAVAKIGNIYYSTLSSAIEHASANATIEIVRDFTMENGCIVDKSLNLDTAGNTITVTSGSNCNNRAFRVDKGTFHVYGGGTIDAKGQATNTYDKNQTHTYNTAGTGCFGAFRAEIGTTLNLENLTLKNYRPQGLNVKILGATASLTNVTINSVCGGGIEVTDDEGANGSVRGSAVLTNCIMTQSNYRDWCSAPLSASGNSTLNVYSTSYSGEYGIYVYSSGGTVNVYGGTYSSNSTHEVLICGSDNNTYSGAVSVINVKGGTFTGPIKCEDNANHSNIINITGGTFSVNPSAYVPTGYTVTENATSPITWTVNAQQ